MYFKIKVFKRETDEDYGWFEMIEEAESKEQAILLGQNEVVKDGDNPEEFNVQVVEMTIEQCIEEEFNDVKRNIRRQYLNKHFDYASITVREYASVQKEFDSNPEILYKALKEYNKKIRIKRWLGRLEGYDKLTIKKYGEYLNKLIDAKTEEEFNKILNNIKKRLEILVDKQDKKCPTHMKTNLVK